MQKSAALLHLCLALILRVFSLYFLDSKFKGTAGYRQNRQAAKEGRHGARFPTESAGFTPRHAQERWCRQIHSVLVPDVAKNTAEAPYDGVSSAAPAPAVAAEAEGRQRQSFLRERVLLLLQLTARQRRKNNHVPNLQLILPLLNRPVATLLLPSFSTPPSYVKIASRPTPHPRFGQAALPSAESRQNKQQQTLATFRKSQLHTPRLAKHTATDPFQLSRALNTIQYQTAPLARAAVTFAPAVPLAILLLLPWVCACTKSRKKNKP